MHKPTRYTKIDAPVDHIYHSGKTSVVESVVFDPYGNLIAHFFGPYAKAYSSGFIIHKNKLLEG